MRKSTTKPLLGAFTYLALFALFGAPAAPAGNFVPTVGGQALACDVYPSMYGDMMVNCDIEAPAPPDDSTFRDCMVGISPAVLAASLVGLGGPAAFGALWYCHLAHPDSD